MPKYELLFSVSALGLPAVQEVVFGHEVPTRPDILTGFRSKTNEDERNSYGPARVVLWPGVPADTVEGAVLTLTAAQLQTADRYEGEVYGRLVVTTESGDTAWIHLDKENLAAWIG